MSTRLKAGVGAALLALLVSGGFWLNAGADGPRHPALLRSFLGTTVSTITVDGMPGVAARELGTASPDGGYVASYNSMISTASAIYGKPVLSGPAHGNWRWVRGSKGPTIEGFGVAYLFDAETKALVGHEAVKWWNVDLLEDGTLVNRWEAQYYDANGNPLLPTKLTGGAQGGQLTEATPLE